MRACTCIYTFTRTRMELDHCSDPSATESQKRATRKDIYIYETMVATSCDLNVPRCTTKAQQVRLHGSREVSSLITDPPGTPVIPCCNKIYHI